MLRFKSSFGLKPKQLCRSFSTVRARFDPKKILPSKFGHVRVIGNTTRDAQQSNLSAEMAHEHRIEISKYIDAVYKDMDEPRGYEQIWGGTIPMFDIWKRGAQPFDSIREQAKYLPNTPTSALIRGQALVAMGSQPNDVVDSFIKYAVNAGVDVYTTFDAHNDARNHRGVAEAVHKYGAHYQGCLSYAVFREDPTIYNVQWAVNFFREVVAMGAHSLYLKDPSGVLTPEMAHAIVSEVKAAFPDLPLVIHTHYQTGYAYMTYLEAVKAGANGVECSFGFSDGAGQPYGLTMLRTFEDLGFETGKMNKKAMIDIDNYCKTIRPLYSQSVVRTPDLSVEANGIAGGQRTILDKELIDAGQASLIPKVEISVAEVRARGGKICQVTPVADAYARESMRRLRGGAPDKNFSPGYASMLRGEWGYLKEPVDPKEQAQALIEKCEAFLKEAKSKNLFSNELITQLTANNNAHLHTIREQSNSFCKPVMLARRILELETRLKELEHTASKPHLLASMNRKIADAAARDSNGNLINNLDDRVKLIKAEVESVKKELASSGKVSAEEYENLYLGKADDQKYKNLLASAQPALPSNLSLSQYKSLFSSLSFISGAASATLEPGMPAARNYLNKFDNEHVLGLTTEGETLKEESATLVAVFGKSVVPNMLDNFFLNYRENKSFWPLTYKPKDAPAPVSKDSSSDKDFLFLNLHSQIENAVGAINLSQIVESKSKINFWLNRLARVEKGDLKGVYGADTLAKLNQRIAELKANYEIQRNSLLPAIKQLASNPLISAKYPKVEPLTFEQTWNKAKTEAVEKKLTQQLDALINAKASKA